MKAVTTLPTHKKAGLLLGPALALAMLLAPPPGDLSLPAWHLAAIAVWMGAWWATEALPVPMTGTLPLLLFPLLGIATPKATVTPYANNIIFLVLSGFMLALAIERWGLHRRLALLVLQVMGRTGSSLTLGFMLPAGLASMLISNTAVTLMLMPIALAVLKMVAENNNLSPRLFGNFAVAVLLGIAYSTSIGGIATPIGTPPNALAAAFMQQELDFSLSFASWMALTAPFSLAMILLCWYVLTRWLYPVDFRSSDQAKGELRKMYRQLGPMSREEKISLIVFLCVAGAWIARPLLTQIPALAGLTDTSIALFGAFVLFGAPLGQKGSRLLDWSDTGRLPWGLLLMFGGGLSLAAAATDTGLAAAMGQLLLPLGGWGLLALVAGLVALIVLLTELNSNTATTAAMLPVITALAIGLDIAPELLIMPMVLAVSCAFMLPTATMPNSIVYSTGQISIAQMVRAGLLLNLIAIVLASLFGYFAVPLWLG